MLFSLQLSSQEDDCVRQLDYNVDKSITYGLISELESIDYSSLNLSKLRPFSTSYRYSLCVDHDGHFTSEKIFDSPAHPGDEWSTSIFKIKNKKGEISLFDENDIQVFHNSPDENGMGDLEAMSLEEIQWIGLEHKIMLPSEAEVEWIMSEGLQVYQLGINEVLIKGQNLEWTLNDLDQTILTKEFDNGQLIHSLFLKLNPISDSTAVRIYSIEESFEEIESGILAVKTEKKVFSHFTLNGEQLLSNDLKTQTQIDQVQKSYVTEVEDHDTLFPHSELMISPNPSMSDVQLNLPLRGTGILMDVEIIDLMGNSVYPNTSHYGGDVIRLDISTWSKGVYIVNVRFLEEEIIKRLIKE